MAGLRAAGNRATVTPGRGRLSSAAPGREAVGAGGAGRVGEARLERAPVRRSSGAGPRAARRRAGQRRSGTHIGTRAQTRARTHRRGSRRRPTALTGRHRAGPDHGPGSWRAHRSIHSGGRRPGDSACRSAALQLCPSRSSCSSAGSPLLDIGACPQNCRETSSATRGGRTGRRRGRPEEDRRHWA
jgi:hypothetical protein